MASFVSPGVYVRELDFSAFASRISGSVVGLVGTAGNTEKTMMILECGCQDDLVILV